MGELVTQVYYRGEIAVHCTVYLSLHGGPCSQTIKSLRIKLLLTE
jgi:hypothetical protein